MRPIARHRRALDTLATTRSEARAAITDATLNLIGIVLVEHQPHREGGVGAVWCPSCDTYFPCRHYTAAELALGLPGGNDAA